MLNTIIRKLSIYRNKRLRKNTFTKTANIGRRNNINLAKKPMHGLILGVFRKRKVKNTFNPFSSNKKSHSIVEVITTFMNMTPEQEEASMQRVMNMVKLIVHPYREEKIDDMVSKFTHVNTVDDYYYEVQKIKMNQEQYQQYLDKKSLNENLHKKLPLRKKEKRAKL